MAVQENPLTEKVSLTEGAAGAHLESAQATTRRSNNFNLLRLLFAALVLLSHAPELADGNGRREPLMRLFHTVSFGEVAVAGFFLLSGCLIVQSWRRTPDLADFLQKRMLRIYPGFIAASLLSALIVGSLAGDATHYFAQFNLPHFVKGMLLLRTPVVPPVFAGMHYPEVNGSMWTIAYEFRCYLLVAGLGALGLLGRRGVWLALTGAALLLSALPAAIARIHFPGGHLLLGDMNALARLLPLFCVGGCFALFPERLRLTNRGALLAALGLGLSLCLPVTAHLGLATFGAYLLFWAAQVQSPALARLRSLPDVSYGVYLYGWPVEMLLLWFVPGIAPWLVFALACVLCAGLGLASWFGVERPFLHLKRGKRTMPTDTQREGVLSPALPGMG